MPDAPRSAPPDDAIALGPAGLGLVLSTAARAGADGSLEHDAFADPALEGPPGVLQGGFAALLPALVARRVDAHGAPLTALEVRLRAPTSLGRWLGVAVRPVGVARHSVSVVDDGRALVEAEVEYAGSEPVPASDLVALARSRPFVPTSGPTSGPTPRGGPGPEDDPHPTCFVCGHRALHPLALRLRTAPLGDDAASAGWVAEESLAGESLALPRGTHVPGVVDESVVAAVLDCASARAALPVARDAGFGGVVLGTLSMRSLAPVPVLDPVRVVARVDGRDGRRIAARAAIVDDDGTVLTVVSVVHVAVPEMPALRELAG